MSLNKRATIKQVAQEAGVSLQTVSRVANNHPDVSPATRRKVQKVINRLHYQPSNIARTLIRGRSWTLGVVGTGLEFYGPSHTLAGIEKQADASGYQLQLCLIRQPERNDVQFIWRDMLSRQVDGIIWAVPEIGCNRNWVKKERPYLSVPVVFLSMQPHHALSVVAINNRAGGRDATQHLLEQGYRKIGLITGPAKWWEVRERRAGWAEALQSAGIPFDSTLIAEGDWTPGSGERGVQRLLQRHPDMDAVFVCNDQMAFGALKVARELGRQVPQTLGVVGFDNIPESAYSYPSLTSVGQDLIELGSHAVQELCRIIEASKQGQIVQPKTILIPPRLLVRESSVMALPRACKCVTEPAAPLPAGGSL